MPLHICFGTLALVEYVDIVSEHALRHSLGLAAGSGEQSEDEDEETESEQHEHEHEKVNAISNKRALATMNRRDYMDQVST